MELTINNITKQYGNVTVLDDVSYRFTPGIYGILGANGAGKTTLFRIMNNPGSVSLLSGLTEP